MITEQINDDDRAILAKWIGDASNIIETRIQRMTPSRWAESKRIMPQGLTDLPGPFRWSTTPYLREIIDQFRPGNGVHKVAIMKGAQLGFSVGVLENLIGWIIDCEPGPTLFVTADRELAESVVETRVDRMIESAGIAHKIFAQVEKSHGRKTGDTKSKKEFPGGFLLPVGPNVGGKLRSYSIKTILFDELDGFPLEVGDEGDPVKLAERRTDAFSRRRKILYISTPTTEETSRIRTLYESGDQRRYYVPCPHCQAMQILEWKHIHYQTDDHGRLIWPSVHYECQACHGEIKNHHKQTMLMDGEWRPTAEPREPGLVSYHLSSLYSPIGFRPWESIVQEWVEVKDNPSALRVFINTALGETWQERGDAPDWARIMLRREEHQSGTLPPEARPLVLTLGADVQADRIECELIAWCQNFESYSLQYYVFEGDTAELDGPAWQALANVLQAEHEGLHISMALIDAGFRTGTVYKFCEQYAGGVMPCMGESTGSLGRQHFVLRKVPGHACERVDVQTGLFKTEIYGYLGRGPTAQGYPPGYCHFPADYTEAYFKQLTAEERVRVKTKSGAPKWEWKQIRNRNEALDCRVYAMAALYVFASMVKEEINPNGTIPWADFWRLVGGEGVEVEK